MLTRDRLRKLGCAIWTTRRLRRDLHRTLRAIFLVGFLFFSGLPEFVDRANKQEDCTCHNEKVDQQGNEVSIIPGNRSGFSSVSGSSGADGSSSRCRDDDPTGWWQTLDVPHEPQVRRPNREARNAWYRSSDRKGSLGRDRVERLRCSSTANELAPRRKSEGKTSNVKALSCHHADFSGA